MQSLDRSFIPASVVYRYRYMACLQVLFSYVVERHCMSGDESVFTASDRVTHRLSLIYTALFLTDLITVRLSTVARSYRRVQAAMQPAAEGLFLEFELCKVVHS